MHDKTFWPRQIKHSSLPCRIWLLFVVPCGFIVGPQILGGDDARLCDSDRIWPQKRRKLVVRRQSVIQGLQIYDNPKMPWGTKDDEKETPKAEKASKETKAADGQRQSESPRLFQQRANWNTFTVLSLAIALHMFTMKNKTTLNMLRGFFLCFVFYVHITIFCKTNNTKDSTLIVLHFVCKPVKFKKTWRLTWVH